MKKSFYQRWFGNREVRKETKGPIRRSLALESLEDRCLLAAWSGFEYGVVENYPLSSGGLGFESSPDMLQVTNLNGDTVASYGIPLNDFVAVNFDTNTISTYLYDDSDYTFSNSTTFEGAGFQNSDDVSMVFGDFDHDNVQDDLLVLRSADISVNTGKTMLTLLADIYSYDSQSGAYTQTLDSQALTVSIGTSGTFWVTDLSTAVTSDSGKLVVQLSAMNTTNGSEYNYLVGFNTGSWTTPATIYSSNFSSTVYDLHCTAKLPVVSGTMPSETEFIVSSWSDSTSTAKYYLRFTPLTANGSSYDWCYSNDGVGVGEGFASLDVDWVTAPATATVSTYQQTLSGVLYLGGYAPISGGYDNRLLTVDFKSLIQNDFDCSEATFYTTNTPVTVENQQFAIGDIDANFIPDVIISDGSSFEVYLAEHADLSEFLTATNRVTGFDQYGSTATISPEYHSSYLVDILAANGNAGTDGVNDLVMVGTSAIWIRNGLDSDSENLVKISLPEVQTSTQALFGYFNDDDLLDIVLVDSTSSCYLWVQKEVVEAVPAFERTRIWSDNLSIPKSFSVGNFTRNDVDQLAVLVEGNTNQAIYIYDSSSATKVKEFALAGKTKTTIYTGAFFDDDEYDDFAFLDFDGTSAGLQLIKNTAGNFVADTRLTLRTGTTSKEDAVSIALGDVDNSGVNDIVYLYSSKSGQGSLGYFLYDDATGYGSSSATVLKNDFATGSILKGLTYGFVDQDEYDDILFTVSTLNATTSLYDVEVWTLLGVEDSDGSYFKREETSEGSGIYNYVFQESITVQSVANFTESGFVAGRFDQNYSIDVLFTAKSSLVYWVNSASASGAVGQFFVLCQGAFSTSSQELTTYTYETATGTARTWIDEWSGFYLDVWGKTNGMGAITSFSIVLDYDVDYHSIRDMVSGSLAGTDVTITSFEVDSVNGKVLIDGTYTGDNGNTEESLLIRVRVAPIQTDNVPGVSLEGKTELASVTSGLNVVKDSCKLNGLGLLSVERNVTDLPLYAVTVDFDDDGRVTTNDFGLFSNAFGLSEDAWSSPFVDIDNDGRVTTNDFGLFSNAFGLSKNNLMDSFYEKISFIPAVITTPATPASVPQLEPQAISGESIFVAASVPVVAASTLPSQLINIDYLSALLSENEKEDKEEILAPSVENWDPVDDLVNEFLTRTVKRRALGSSMAD